MAKKFKQCAFRWQEYRNKHRGAKAGFYHYRCQRLTDDPTGLCPEHQWVHDLTVGQIKPRKRLRLVSFSD